MSAGACNMLAVGGGTASISPKKARREPTEIAARQRGRCDNCGGKAPRRNRFCSPNCRTTYWNTARLRGAQMYEFAWRWRRYRGRKGTAGQGMIGEMARRVDAFIAEDRAAQKPERDN